MVRKLFVLLAILFLAACAPATAAVSSNGTNPDATKPANSGNTAQDVVMIVYQTSGGFSGVTTTWTIYSGGKISSDKGETLSATPDQVTTLRDNLVNAGFTTQANGMTNMPRLQTCADCTTSSVTLTIDGKPVTLSIVNESSDTPQEAMDLINQVSSFITMSGHK